MIVVATMNAITSAVDEERFGPFGIGAIEHRLRQDLRCLGTTSIAKDQANSQNDSLEDNQTPE